jgi:hypothetical protein
MQTFKSVAGMVVLGTLVMAPLVKAQDGPTINIPFNLALTATIQNPESDPDSKGTVKETTTTLKLTSANILKMAATNHNMTYPSGASLVMDTDGNIVVVKGTNVIDDLSDMLTVTTGNSVDSGTYNENTDAEKDSSQMVFTIAFDDANGTSFTLYGLIKASQSASVVKATTLTWTISFSGSVVGDGSAVNKKDSNNSDQAVWSGTVSGSGKGSALLDD